MLNPTLTEILNHVIDIEGKLARALAEIEDLKKPKPEPEKPAEPSGS